MSDGMLEMECCRGLTVIAVIKAKEFSDNWYVDNLYSFKNKQINKKTLNKTKQTNKPPTEIFWYSIGSTVEHHIL